MATVTQKRPLSENDQHQLRVLADDAAWTRDLLRKEVVKALGYASFREVSEATDISTNTLQKWKREAGK